MIRHNRNQVTTHHKTRRYVKDGIYGAGRLGVWLWGKGIIVWENTVASTAAFYCQLMIRQRNSYPTKKKTTWEDVDWWDNWSGHMFDQRLSELIRLMVTLSCSLTTHLQGLVNIVGSLRCKWCWRPHLSVKRCWWGPSLLGYIMYGEDCAFGVGGV